MTSIKDKPMRSYSVSGARHVGSNRSSQSGLTTRRLVEKAKRHRDACPHLPSTPSVRRYPLQQSSVTDYTDAMRAAAGLSTVPSRSMDGLSLESCCRTFGSNSSFQFGDQTLVHSQDLM